MFEDNSQSGSNLRSDINGVLRFRFYHGPVSRLQLLICIGLVSFFASSTFLFCTHSDNPLFCYIAVAYISGIFVSTVRGRLMTIGEEISGGCLFGLMLFFAALIPPLLVYLLFAKEKVVKLPEPPVQDSVTKPINSQVTEDSSARTNKNLESSLNVFDVKTAYENLIKQKPPGVQVGATKVSCAICRRRVKAPQSPSGKSFRGEGLTGPSYARQDFSAQNLQSAKLFRAPFDFSNFDNADLSYADMQRSYFFKASFRGACLRGAKLGKSDLTGADFENADLAGADLVGSRIGGANFKNADLTNADFDLAEMIHGNPSDKSLIGKLPNFEGSNYKDALHLNIEEMIGDMGAGVSENGYFKPRQELSTDRLVQLLDKAIEVETWMKDEIGDLFERHLIEAAIRRNPIAWMAASNQPIHAIIENWTRNLDSVWAERLAAMVFTQVPELVATRIFGPSGTDDARMIFEIMITEGTVKPHHLNHSPIGILSEYINHQINVFDVLREMRSNTGESDVDSP